MSEESKSDVVKEARELLETHSIVAMRVDKPYKEIRPLISALCDEVEQLKSLNQTQAESIETFQSQQRVMKEAIEAAIPWIEAEIDSLQCSTHDQPAHCADCALRYRALALVKQLRSAITPKGSQK